MDHTPVRFYGPSRDLQHVNKKTTFNLKCNGVQGDQEETSKQTLAEGFGSETKVWFHTTWVSLNKITTIACFTDGTTGHAVAQTDGAL